ncbi:Calcium-dependent protein kinase 26 [Durusdinium trenchii]|uniref:Calcium-dependent protein kinase 26 n=1 Tax=Durusdinium trenchii TaxID=1381693 RepID=A0ABP0JAC2_9DINO
MPEEPSTRLFREAFALGREIRVDETSQYRHMELAWPEYLVAMGAIMRLQQDFDPEFFAESLSNFFETLIPLSDSLLAGNPATAGRKVGNSKDQALLVLIAQVFQEADEDETGTIDQTEFRTFFQQPKVRFESDSISWPRSNLNMMFNSMDADGQGLLTFDELCDGFLKMASIMRSNERAISYIRKVFTESDDDGSGSLDKATDLSDLFSLIDEERCEAEWERPADLDGSGALDKYEYVTAWNLWERCFAPKPCRSLPGKAFSEEQVTQQLMARNLKVPDWEGLFEVLDADGSGTLQWDELREGAFFLSIYLSIFPSFFPYFFISFFLSFFLSS